MNEKQVGTEAELCALAKEAWMASGKTQMEAAAELGVSQPTLAQALNEPGRSLTKLRIAVIERYSDFTVSGPIYQLERKTD